MTPSATARPAPSKRSFRTSLAVIVAFGAAGRIAIWIAKWNQQLLLNDSYYYSLQAFDLAHGHLYREPFTTLAGAEHPPLTSTLMAAVSWMDDVVRWQRLITVLCGIATVALIGLLGRAIAGRRAGLIAATLAAVYPNLWMNDGLVMSESVSVLGVVIVLILAHRAMSPAAPAGSGCAPSGRGASALWSGVAVGFAILARSELVLLIPLVAILVAGVTWRGDRRGALVRAGFVVGAAAIVLAPWIGFNLARFERPVVLTTNDGTTLAGAYCPDSFSGSGLGGWSLLCIVNDPDDAEYTERSVRAAYRRDVAIDYARGHLGELPKVVVARLGRTLDLYGLDNLVFQDVGEERWRWASWAGIVSFWALAPAAAIGLVRLPRRDRLLLLVPVVVVLITTVVFYGAHRIRSSAEPSVVIGAAAAIDVASRRWRVRRSGVRREHAPGAA